MSNDESVALLPLVVDTPEYDKTRVSSYRLLADPAVATSVKYDFAMNQFDGSEGLREMLNFLRNLKKLAKGSGLDDPATATNAPTLITMTQRMLHSSAAQAYDQGIAAHVIVVTNAARHAAYQAHILGNATDARAPTATEKRAAMADYNAVAIQPANHACHEAGLQEMTKVLAPFRALARVKRYLRRQCRKPADMSIRSYVSHFMRINEEELELLPPFLTTNKLELSEMIEIWQYAIPSSWNRKMQEQGKDPVTMTMAAFIETTEFIESAEKDFEKVPRKEKSSSSSNKKTKKKSYSNSKDADSKSYYCTVHGKNSTHASADCKVLNSKDGDKKSFSKNKSWGRDADKAKYKSKKDFNAFVAKAVKKELNAFVNNKKKRKADLHAVDAKEDDSDEDISLKDFDYSTLKNLSFNGSCDNSVDDEDSKESFDTAKEE